MADPLGKRLVSAILTTEDAGVLPRHSIDSSDIFDDARIALDWVTTYFREHSAWPDAEMVAESTGVELPPEDKPIDYVANMVRERSLAKRITNTTKAIIEKLDDRAPDDALKLMGDGALALRSRGKAARPVSFKEDAESRIKRYEELKAGGGLLGLPTPWHRLNKNIQGWVDGTLNVVTAMANTGKCVSADTPIRNPVTGAVQTVAHAVEHRWDVLSLNLATGKHEIKTPAAWVDTGTKDCLKITWKSGKTLTCTPEHPLLGVNGWQRADTLQVRDFTVLTRRIPEPLVTQSQDLSTIDLHAALIADGGVTAHPTYTKGDPALIDLVTETHKKITGLDATVLLKTPTKCELSLPGLRNWLRQYMLRVKSIHKVLPDWVFALPNAELARYLGVLWSHDGSVENNHGWGKLSYSSASKKLVRQVQHLLLRFGIVCSYREKETASQLGPGVGAAEIAVLGRFANDFLREIPLLGIKADTAMRLPWGSGRWPRPGKYLKYRADYPLRAERGLAGDPSGRGYCESEEVFWDRIEKIEAVGPQRVYDLSVPDNHCFVCADMPVHNTWFLCHCANHSMDLGKKVLFVTLEMDIPRIERRLEATRYKIPFGVMRSCEMDPDGEALWKEAVRRDVTEAEGDIIFADKQLVKTVSDVHFLALDYKPDVIYIDGGYRFTVPGKGGSGEWANTVEIVNDLQLSAEATQVPWVVSTQQGDANETGKAPKKGKKMHMWGIRYGKEWVINPDTVIGLYADDDMRLTKTLEIHQLKTRDSAGDSMYNEFPISWDLTTMNFAEIDDPAAGAPVDVDDVFGSHEVVIPDM